VERKSPLLGGSNGDIKGYTDEGLIRISHQIFTTYEAEDSDIIIFVQNSESTENLIERGAAGGHIIYHQYILLADI
jgi:hypothetical protein